MKLVPERIDMGKMVDGTWYTDVVDAGKAKNNGRFVRPDSVFHCGGFDGSDPSLQAEPGRFHLYLSKACPWAHRTVVARALLGLEEAISISYVHWLMLDDGWTFDGDFADPLHGRRFLREVYAASDPHYTGRVTVPVLWDKRDQRIVCNESSEILRLLNTDFRPWASSELDLYPERHRAAIDRINSRVYDTLNNGVYKCGFASNQEAYLEAVQPLFETLDWLEAQLADRKWLLGDAFTEADIRLFTTAIRFDPVYYSHFKCSQRRLVDYPNLWRWTRDVYALPGVAQTVDIEHAKRHYFQSHTSINPRGVVPIGPHLDYTPES